MTNIDRLAVGLVVIVVVWNLSLLMALAVDWFRYGRK